MISYKNRTYSFFGCSNPNKISFINLEKDNKKIFKIESNDLQNIENRQKFAFLLINNKIYIQCGINCETDENINDILEIDLIQFTLITIESNLPKINGLNALKY